MLINTPNLEALRTGFSTAYQGAFDAAETAYGRVAMTVPSSTKQNTYGWMLQLPGLREWVGPRQVKNISEASYTIVNKSYELTIGVDRDDIEDDNLGVYTPLFQEMGSAVKVQPDELVFGLLKDGFTTECFDGQYFFDTDHPIVGADGSATTYANTDSGSGTPWYLLCTRRAVKPLVFQNRRDPAFVAKDNPTDSNVFSNREFRYGVDCRRNVGFAFPQLAWGSKQTLDATHYATARAGIMNMKGDQGRPLGLVPDLLVVPPSLEGAGRALLQSQLVNGGESNPWAGTAELLVVPWLA